MLSGLSPVLFVDPQFSENPRVFTKAALRSMVRLRILEEHRGSYALTSRRTHPQFPDVPDIVAFQARFLAETLAASAVIARPEVPVSSLTLPAPAV